MPYRDENGHFISKDEFDRKIASGQTQSNNRLNPRAAQPNAGTESPTESPAESPEDESGAPAYQGGIQQRPAWSSQADHPRTIFVETGRGQSSEVPVGADFAPTINSVAEAAHYGGYYRVFLNGEELVNPEEAPAKIEAGMRIAITSYDKVG